MVLYKRGRRTLFCKWFAIKVKITLNQEFESALRGTDELGRTATSFTQISLQNEFNPQTHWSQFWDFGYWFQWDEGGIPHTGVTSAHYKRNTAALGGCKQNSVEWNHIYNIKKDLSTKTLLFSPISLHSPADYQEENWLSLTADLRSFPGYKQYVMRCIVSGSLDKNRNWRSLPREIKEFKLIYMISAAHAATLNP